jgi:uncharacterized protein YdcH (DUF465 family)
MEKLNELDDKINDLESKGGVKSERAVTSSRLDL